MSLQLVHFSNWGGYRPSNQDAYCVRLGIAPLGILAMLVICDGMGGMNCGEVASATLVTAFKDWFDIFAPQATTSSLATSVISREWHKIVLEKHRTLQAYAKNNGWRIGTTLSAILLTPKQYFLMHVGDTRIYLSDFRWTEQLTRDQTLAMRELEAGRISLEEYQRDARKNVLLQCVGEQSVNPLFLVGEMPQKGAALLCSDGFYHTVASEEIHYALTFPGGKAELQQNLLSLANRARIRGETDNMTCVALRWNDFSGNSEKLASTSVNTVQMFESLANVFFINGETL